MTSFERELVLPDNDLYLNYADPYLARKVSLGIRLNEEDEFTTKLVCRIDDFDRYTAPSYHLSGKITEVGRSNFGKNWEAIVRLNSGTVCEIDVPEHDYMCTFPLVTPPPIETPSTVEDIINPQKMIAVLDRALKPEAIVDAHVDFLKDLLPRVVRKRIAEREASN
jgi:hypothetical protein